MIAYINIFYLVSAVCFILGIKKLSHPKTARSGNTISAIGMLIAIITVLYQEFILSGEMNWGIILIGIAIGTIIGIIAAIKVEMTQMPQLVAIFNGFGGGASAFIASSEFLYKNDPSMIIMFSVIIGTLTFTGSFIAFGKLQGLVSSKPITYPAQQVVNGLVVIGLIASSIFLVYNAGTINYFYLIFLLSALIGITLTICDLS